MANVKPLATPGEERTVLCGLVGCGIQSSRTPRLHEVEGARQGMRYAYRLFDMDEPPLTSSSLSEVIRAAELCGFAGLNVTYPFKIEAADLVDKLSPNARKTGAVNAIVFRDGRRYGHNTDLWGFAEGFRRGLPDVPRDHVLLIGAGGAGAAVALALMDLGVGRLSIHDANHDRAEALVEMLNAAGHPDRAVAVATPTAARDIDGLINATPVGMRKVPGMAAPPEMLRPGLWVVDIVYFPLETELLARAREAGCRVLSGEGMAVFQATRAFELFTGVAADSERMTEAFRQHGQ
jgi:shikimate dehydrogenase